MNKEQLSKVRRILRTSGFRFIKQSYNTILVESSVISEKESRPIMGDIRGILDEDFTLIIETSSSPLTRAFGPLPLLKKVADINNFTDCCRVTKLYGCLNIPQKLCGKTIYNLIVSWAKGKEKELKDIFKSLPRERQRILHSRLNEGAYVGKINIYDAKTKKLVWYNKKYANYAVIVQGPHPSIVTRYPVVIKEVDDVTKTIVVNAHECICDTVVVYVENGIPTLYCTEFGYTTLAKGANVKVKDKMKIIFFKDNHEPIYVPITT